jgi:hypothetical protein
VREPLPPMKLVHLLAEVGAGMCNDVAQVCKSAIRITRQSLLYGQSDAILPSTSVIGRFIRRYAEIARLIVYQLIRFNNLYIGWFPLLKLFTVQP